MNTIVTQSFKAHIEGDRLIFDEDSANIFGLKKGKGVMFYFNYADKQCWFKFEDRKDSFRFASYNGNLSIYNRDLCEKLTKCFRHKKRPVYHLVQVKKRRRIYLV